jgi:cytochrome c553
MKPFFERASKLMTKKVAAGAILAALLLPDIAAAEVDFAKDLRPFIEARCSKCHDAKKQKGGVDFSVFNDVNASLKKHKIWRSALEQIQTKEMPPDDEPAMTDAERAKLAGTISSMLALLDSNDPKTRDPGPPLLRRLSRVEYNLTIRDLTGLDFDAADSVGMPDDTPVTGFATYAAGQTISAALMEKYFAAADKIVERFKTASEPGVKKSDKDRVAFDALFAPPTDEKVDARGSAKYIISAFARRAFRRPARADEIASVMKFYDAAIAKKEPQIKAELAMLKPVLVSPAFLFRAEKEASDAKAPYRISDLELATRLSYFLWSTMPDEALLALAEQNKLSDEKTLDEQLKRMLASPKARALTDNFAAYWLQFRKVNEARPSTEFYPAFNGKLRAAMLNETAMFWDKLREDDRNVLELLDADYTYVNEPLAKLYGIDGVKGEKMQRVSLKPEQHRGGLLGMGSVLALTSHTNRTSPTLRGKWVLEVLFNNPPAPPPANAGMFKDEGRNKKEPKTFREKLAMHAADATCAACHKKIDPLGFGLENFDAIGSWRESGKDIDASGQLAGGEKFNGVGELKKIVLKHQDDFERGLIGNMLSYAIGRELEWTDEREISAIKAAMEKNGHRFSTLIAGIAKSYPMQYRRGE